MPKIVLLPVSGTAADADVFAAALTIGRLFDSHLVALHTRPDVRRDIAALSASDGGMMVGIDTMISQMEAESDSREKSAVAAWTAFCGQNGINQVDHPGVAGVTSEWVSETGTAADYLAAHGRTAGLIVAGRGEPEWGPDYALMEAALMDTGAPVLIAPRTDKAVPAPIDGIVGIAWKDTPESAAAVQAALPFVQKSSHVIVFTVVEDDDGDKSHLRLAKMLRWHNSNVTIQALRDHAPEPVDLLRDAAVKAGCGLLVMGAYGHTRLREAVFGGFTRAMLEDAPLPLLMAH